VTSARDQIIRILESLTDISAAELGRRVGVSRERVRQILKDLGYPTARGKGRPYGPAMPAQTAFPAGRRLGKPVAIKIVAEDLLRKGYAIFAPVKVTQACDLVAVGHQGTVTLITICLPGKRATKTRLSGPVRALSRCCAWVTTGTPIRYEPPLPSPGHKPRGN
jgi:hypothetical protein